MIRAELDDTLADLMVGPAPLVLIVGLATLGLVAILVAVSFGIRALRATTGDSSPGGHSSIVYYPMGGDYIDGHIVTESGDHVDPVNGEPVGLARTDDGHFWVSNDGATWGQVGEDSGRPV